MYRYVPRHISWKKSSALRSHFSVAEIRRAKKKFKVQHLKRRFLSGSLVTTTGKWLKNVLARCYQMHHASDILLFSRNSNWTKSLVRQPESLVSDDRTALNVEPWGGLNFWEFKVTNILSCFEYNKSIVSQEYKQLKYTVWHISGPSTVPKWNTTVKR